MLPVPKMDPVQLNHLIRSGEQSRFEKLYDQYSPVLYGWILGKVKDVNIAEELFCRSFLKVVKNLEKYNPEKCNFLTWLIQVSSIEISSHNGDVAKVLTNTISHQSSAQISIQTGA